MPQKRTVHKAPIAKRKSKKGGSLPWTKLSKFALVLVIFAGGYAYLKYRSHGIGTGTYVSNSMSLKRTRDNYGLQLDNLGRQFDISHAYLKALATLECSGRAEFPPRFEEHVYQQLKRVRDGKQKNYGSITRKIIGDASDDALRNLATSWGPFQLMGYQCIELGVNVADIRGSNSLYWGVYWIEKRYGKYLRREAYADAFHMHNTGRPFPSNGISQTYDPKYVENGLKFMTFFEQTSYE